MVRWVFGGLRKPFKERLVRGQIVLASRSLGVSKQRYRLERTSRLFVMPTMGMGHEIDLSAVRDRIGALDGFFNWPGLPGLCLEVIALDAAEPLQFVTQDTH